MPVTLVSGANRGLGRETARRLRAAGHDVWLGSRDEERGRAAAAALGTRFVQLDTADEASVAAATQTVAAETGLDVLVNNAGVGARKLPVAEVTVAEIRGVYETNVFGLVRMMGAFLPLLERSTDPVVVNVSSGMGSFGVTHDRERFESTLVGLAYPSSKAALNMLTAMYAKAYPQMRINAVDPGHTATDINGGTGRKTVDEGATVIVEAARFGKEDPSGVLLDEDGRLPW
jgi:NAD(P)-dependent dehydrogenase (short-subunit alcohol dehydrogenase family)